MIGEQRGKQLISLLPKAFVKIDKQSRWSRIPEILAALHSQPLIYVIMQLVAIIVNQADMEEWQRQMQKQFKYHRTNCSAPPYVVAGETNSFSLGSLSASSRNSCDKMSSALYLSSGSSSNIQYSRSMASMSSGLYLASQRSNYRPLFFMQTYWLSFPSKRYLLVSRTCRMTPAEKMSQIGSIFSLEVMPMISGAMQPGVPQRQKMQGQSSLMAARPKSTMTTSRDPFDLSMMFSSLISRCMMPYLCMQLRPQMMPFMILFTSGSLNPLSQFILSKSVPPSSSSVMMQTAEADSKTSIIFNIFQCSMALSKVISLNTLLFLYGLLSRKLFKKTLAANIFPSVRR